MPTTSSTSATPTTSMTSLRSGRTVPFTPKRPLSQDDIPAAARFVRANTPLNDQPQPAKKYKSSISAESRVRSTVSTSATTTRPKTPSKSNSHSNLSANLHLPSTPTRSRSTTPAPPSPSLSPRKRNDSRAASPLPGVELSKMDVTNVDPEEALVDYQNVDVSSGDIDEAMLRQIDRGKEDKVLVSVRIRPSTKPSAWTHSTTNRTIKLDPTHAKSGTQPQEFRFDEVLTGSDNRPVYNSAARSHVCAAMDGYNAVIFAYGQTASGKTFTLTGDDEHPGIIPRAMKDIFAYIRRTPTREYLLRCSYLEIYNESIHDLLSPPSSSLTHAPVSIQGIGDNVVLSPLREEVVTSLKGVKGVLERGYANRRTASTDWNERSSRSHSVFRVVVESRERGSGGDETGTNGRATPAPVPPTPGGTRLQSRGGRSVQTSVLSLIDLAGSEKATSDKDRTREGKYINTSLLTLGTVIATLGENAVKGKTDHVPFRNSKLTRMLQPSLSGNARISVICTINPEPGAIAESTSTLLFAQRVKRVQLNAQKKEIVDTEALLERYRKEIEDLKRRLAEREAEAPTRTRRLSAREQLDESRAMGDINSRIRQLTKLILTSQSVDEAKGDESRPASPSKLDFDLSPYQLQQELLTARRQLETQATQILSLEAALLARPELPPDAPESEKDRVLAEQTKTIRELEIVVRGYEENLGEPLRAVREDVEREWAGRLEKEMRLRVEKEAWAEELVRQLEKEKNNRNKLEEERRALAAFVTRFDALGLGVQTAIPARLRHQDTGNSISSRTSSRKSSFNIGFGLAALPEEEREREETPSPVKLLPLRPAMMEHVNLMEQTPVEEAWSDVGDVSFDMPAEVEKGKGRADASPLRSVLAGKENTPL
ncbi:kinesin-domain-containing protein [Rickenella mellea]|uniref:Kinesin-like protein n=1 Tax=Rickenella mellea TaxID=50990 RepID=A0A4Y7Q209_9AGAM|nr:kinesin-domain-containing protein [Rickenella mellea]